MRTLRKVSALALLRAFWVGLAALMWLPSSWAHEMTITDLTIREMSAGQYVWSWGVPGRSRPVSEDLSVMWPQDCVGEAQVVQCGPRGLHGTLAVDGLGKGYSAVVMRIYWRSGERQVITLTSRQPSTALFGGAKDERGAGEIAKVYSVLGVQHILSGYDHVLFVLSLLMLVGFQRKLIGTITAFTIAHSLTLGASALGWFTLPSVPVEACIALSILLVCSEALRDRETLSRRMPSLVAFLFGLVHGLGFAGALREIGLPEQHFTMALLTFNLGVELGQLLLVAAVWAVVKVGQRWLAMPPLRQPVLYSMGGIAGYWSIARLVSIFA